MEDGVAVFGKIVPQAGTKSIRKKAKTHSNSCHSISLLCAFMEVSRLTSSDFLIIIFYMCRKI